MKSNLSMKKFNLINLFNLPRQVRAAGVAGITFVSRLGLLPGNISPLGSFGFFGGSPVWFMVSVVAFDVLVGGLYKGFWLTYLGFLIYPLLGKVAGGRWQRQALLLPLASFGFFLISNLGVWWYWYPKTWEGLLLCYTLAVPFYARTLAGDLGFGYGYLVVKNFKPLVAQFLAAGFHIQPLGKRRALMGDDKHHSLVA